MSRRSRRPPRDDGAAPPPPRASPIGAIARDVAILAVVFGVAVAVAELAGAANLGVAFGVGQVAFVVALVALLSRD